MSVTPNNTLPKCTRTAVIDLLFKEKYKLTQTQMLVMYYLLMLKNWVKFIDDGFYVILSSKIERDLQLHPKTVEASLTKLKKLKLIETKRCVVEEWNRYKTYRGIKITELGKEYNLSHYKEEQYQYAVELEKKNKELQAQIEKIDKEKAKLAQQKSDLELTERCLIMHLEADDKLKDSALENIEKYQKLEEKYIALEIENEQLKKEKETKAENKTPKKTEKEKQKEIAKELNDIDKFRKKIIKEFAQSGKAICNCVANEDDWATHTTFYINSYNRLCIILPDGTFRQISNPKQVENFWRWAFYHQDRIGKLLNTKKLADISTLLIFIGAFVLLDRGVYQIKQLQPVVGGVKVTIADSDGILSIMGNGLGHNIQDVNLCKRFFENNSVPKSSNSQ